MGDFWKAAALVLLAVILGTSLGNTGKDIRVVLHLAACCAVSVIALEYLSPVLDFLWQLSNTAGEGGTFVSTLLKIAGIALITELTGMISSDAGGSSLGKAMQILGSSAMLNLSVPMFELLFSMIQEILGYL